MCEEKEMKKLDTSYNLMVAVGFSNDKYYYDRRLGKDSRLRIENCASIQDVFWNGNGIRCVKKKK